jgi:hypothetical protein
MPFVWAQPTARAARTARASRTIFVFIVSLLSGCPQIAPELHVRCACPFGQASRATGSIGFLVTFVDSMHAFDGRARLAYDTLGGRPQLTGYGKFSAHPQPTVLLFQMHLFRQKAVQPPSPCNYKSLVFISLSLSCGDTYSTCVAV